MAATPAPAGIPLCVPTITGREAVYLQEAIASTFVSSVGPFVERFERAFAAATGAAHAVACASGTAAIHLALRALGVGPGDLVLCSDFTFIASANPIAYQQAEVAFIGSEPASWNLDPRLVARALDDLAAVGRRPAAIIAVHVLGQPADLGPLLDAAGRHGVPVIEDAAEALGARYGADYPHPLCAGRQVGTIGRIGCFSFNGNKIITSGGGGMVTTGDRALADRIRHLSTQAKLPGAAFVHDAIGYNYRLTNLAAAFGLAQLEALPRFLDAKRGIAAAYRSALGGLGLQLQPGLPGSMGSDWLPSVLLPGDGMRDLVAGALERAGIASRPLWLPLSRQPCYQPPSHLPPPLLWSDAVQPESAWLRSPAARPAPGAAPAAWGDHLAAHGLSLPCSSALGGLDQDRVIAVIRHALADDQGPTP